MIRNGQAYVGTVDPAAEAPSRRPESPSKLDCVTDRPRLSWRAATVAIATIALLGLGAAAYASGHGGLGSGLLAADPHAAHETTIHLDLAALGFADGDRFEVHDEISGQTWPWSSDNYVRLDPSVEVAHILSVRTA